MLGLLALTFFIGRMLPVDPVIAIVGDYAKVKDQLAAYKNITFLDTDGKVIPAPQ